MLCGRLTCEAASTFRIPRRDGWRKNTRRLVHVAGASSSPTAKIETPAELRIAPWTATPDQLKALETLNKRLQNSSYSLEQETVQWFLRDRQYDPVEAEEKLLKMAQWKQEIDLDNLSPEGFSEELARGKVRLHDYKDVLGRPVIILDASKHFIGEFPVSSTQKLCAYAVREAMDQLNTEVETFITVYDLRNFRTANADLQFIKYMIDLFFVYNPKRLGQSLLVDAPWVFQPVWQITKPLLRKYAKLVRFVSASQLREEYFTENTVPREFKL